MAAECVKRTCASCGFTLKSSDCFPIIIGDLPAEPFKEGHGLVVHCICYKCGEEWVE